MVELGISSCVLQHPSHHRPYWMFLKHWQCQIYCSLWISFTFHWHHKQWKSTPGLLVRRERECRENKKFSGEDDGEEPPSSVQRKDMTQSIKKLKNSSVFTRQVTAHHLTVRGTGRQCIHIHMQTHRKINPWCGPESTVWIENNTGWLSLP